jgi:hypothetical protein
MEFITKNAENAYRYRGNGMRFLFLQQRVESLFAARRRVKPLRFLPRSAKKQAVQGAPRQTDDGVVRLRRVRL